MTITKMTNDKLPPYFRDYFDEKFDNVELKIKGVDSKVEEVQSDVTELKKKMVESSEDRKKIWITLILVGVFLLLHFGTSSTSFLRVLFPMF